MKQVKKTAYQFDAYCGLDRWVSYYDQIREVLALHPKNILEIGTGDGVFKNYIVHNTNIAYTNMDIAEDLHPDIVGNVEHIPLLDNSFDVVCVFEVLEHIPFDKFEIAVSELCRVSKKHVIISLPHFGPSVRLSFKIPFFKEIKLALKIPYRPTHVFNGQHYWEIGKRGYAPRKIEAILRRYMVLEKDFIPFENQYHHFYVLRHVNS